MHRLKIFTISQTLKSNLLKIVKSGQRTLSPRIIGVVRRSVADLRHFGVRSLTEWCKWHKIRNTLLNSSLSWVPIKSRHKGKDNYKSLKYWPTYDNSESWWEQSNRAKPLEMASQNNAKDYIIFYQSSMDYRMKYFCKGQIQGKMRTPLRRNVPFL
jgi:hypothetical protein